MTFNIVLAQINLTVGDIPGNIRKIAVTAERARDLHKAKIVAFPELTITGYPPEDLLLRPELSLRVEQALQNLMHAVPNIVIICGYPRSYYGRLYNCAGVIRDGQLFAEYRKQALPNYGVFDEQRYFLPGATPCVFDMNGVRIGLTICEDVWVAEPARRAKNAGAQLLININASPFNYGKQAEREAQVRQRAQELDLPLLYVNQIGGQDELVFDGGSFVMDKTGTVIQRGQFCLEEDLLVNIQSGQPQPSYISSNLSEYAAIYQALVLGVRDYASKNGFRGAILGLSGGIDSALTLAIAVDALGADQVEAVLMPSRYTATMSNEDAIQEAKALRVAWRTISLEPAFQAFLTLLKDSFTGLATDVTEENIQARCRGVILMALSNKSGKILLTTGNKSELSVGYATLYGDMAGGFAPLKDVFKTVVYRLARYRNELSPIIPERVFERPPSAELRPDQTDQDSLPAYEILDAILRRYVENDESITDIIAAGFDDAMVQKVARMVDLNEYKRRQAPPGVRITRRAFGRDRRYPITCKF